MEQRKEEKEEEKKRKIVESGWKDSFTR